MVKALSAIIIKAYDWASLAVSDGRIIRKPVIIDNKSEALINRKESAPKQARPLAVLDKLGQTLKKCRAIEIHPSLAVEAKRFVHWWGWGEVYCFGGEKVA